MSGVDEFSLRFILFPRHELCGEFRVLFCRFAYIGFVYNPVLLRRCFVVGPRHKWMYPLRFILQQDEY